MNTHGRDEGWFAGLLSLVALSAFVAVPLQAGSPQQARPQILNGLAAGTKQTPLISDFRPVNPKASPEALALLNHLYSISGKRILSGQHNTPGHKPVSAMSEKALEITGKSPAVWGSDFGFTATGKDGIDNRPAIMQEAIRQHEQGAIITLTWHAVCPLDNEPNGWKESVWHKMTDAEWNELVTPGTPLNQHWLAQVDVIAGFLKQLRDAHVPVLWRPYHEMNGDWFWWCGKKRDQGFKALWQLMYGRLVDYHGLNNLLWVWSPNAPGGVVGPYADYFPGSNYVDVLAVDVYIGFKQQFYDDLLALAAGKPVALGEVGKLPSPGVLDAQPKWAWFMEWDTMLTGGNKPEEINTLFHDPRVLNRGE